MKKQRNNIKTIMNISTVVGTILLLVFLYYSIKSQIFTSDEKMQIFLAKCGIYAPICFILIQVVQVIVPLIPGGVSQGVGVVVFGPIFGFIYNYIGIVLGSIIVFFIARKYGMALIQKMFKQEIIDKYIGYINSGKKFEKFFAIAILLPVAPDDFLCYLAGVTDISTKKYITIILLLKPFTIAAYSFMLVFFADMISKLI